MPDAIALVLLPPPHVSAIIDPLRSANDKSYTRGWASHITVLFPFTPVEDLPSLVNDLQSALWSANLRPFDVKLDRVSRFATRDYETVYLGLSSSDKIEALWRVSAEATKHPKDGRLYTPHLTLGQTARNPESIAFLTDKGNRILAQHDLSWHVDSLALLRRRDDLGGIMEMFAQIPICKDTDTATIPRHYGLSGTSTYYHDATQWASATPGQYPITSITVATYNVLHDSRFPLQLRLPALKRAICESDADVLCLQEVTDEFLCAFASDPLVQEHFRWCSRPPNAVMESERNVVMLARENYGFEWTRVELGGKHKAAIVARLRTTKGIVAIAGVHLTAGRSSSILEKKREEISALVAYLQLHHAQDHWIIAGDTNWPDTEPFPQEKQLMDVWSISGGETYDPTVNSLAAATARESRNAEHYDKILIRRGGDLSVDIDGLRLFGVPPPGVGPASDHWGLAASLQLGTTKPTSTIPANIAFAPLELIPTDLTDVELRELCAQYECLPSKAHNDHLKRALGTLRTFVSAVTSTTPLVGSDDIAPPPISSVKLLVAPVGSYAVGYHTPESDIDCVVVGNINPGTFWTLIHRKIRSAGEAASIRLRRFVKDASVQMMELEVLGVKFDLQYCPAGKLIDRWTELASIPRDSPLFALPASTLRTLNAYRDALALLNALPSMESFRLAHRALKLFLKLRGLIGARFGYLGGFHIAFLLARICLLLPPDASPAQIIRAFFYTYSRWDWLGDAVTVPITGVSSGTYRRNLGREPMCILSIEKPAVNMTTNATPHSLNAMQSIFSAADRSLEQGRSWIDICVGPNVGIPTYKQFLREHKAFIKVEVIYWGSSCMKGRALIGWLESRFVNLLVQLHTNVPSISVRLWPSRFSDGTNTDQTLHAFYLFGLDASSSTLNAENTKQLSKEEQARIMGTLVTTIRAFESDLHQNDRYYDPASTFISISRSQLPHNVELDDHKWSDNGFDNEEETSDLDDDATDNSELDLNSSVPISTTVTCKKKRTKVTPHLSASKLRTSSDVFNRLLWDPSTSPVDYMIGYQDRFKGVKEMPLVSWKREVEDEAFIPFHRVVHFRRKTDSTMVWDRKTKTDLVFGSGAVIQTA